MDLNFIVMSGVFVVAIIVVGLPSMVRSLREARCDHKWEPEFHGAIVKDANSLRI